MDEKKIQEFRMLVDDVIDSPTKKDAQISLDRLKLLASSVESSIDSDLYGKLREVINSAQKASGQAQNKNHWITRLNNSWYIFERRVKKLNT